MIRCACLAVVLFGLQQQPQESGLFTSFKGKTPPEIASDKDQWVNGGEEPLQLAKLKNKVVWLQFGFSGCNGCKAMRPNLVKWQKDYAEKGLVIIEVFNAAMDKKAGGVKKFAEREKLAYSVLWDKETKNGLAYGIKATPTAYLIDVDGRVVWEGQPQADPAAREKVIAVQLERIKKDEKKPEKKEEPKK